MTHHDAAADLAYIREVMEQTRRYTAAKGIYFVLWGSLVALALIGTWFQWHRVIGGTNFELWIGAMTAGWLATLWLARREATHGQAPFQARLIGMNWVAVGVAMGTFYFVGVPMKTVGFEAIPGLSALFVGVGIFNTGHLSGLRWLAAVGVCWFVAGGALLAFPGPHTLWAMVALLLLGEVLPGLVLMRQERALRGDAA